MQKSITIKELPLLIGTENEATLRYDKAIEISTNYAKAFYNKGISLYDLGKFNDALIAFNKAYELDPTDIWVWYYRGFIFAKQEKYNEANESADKFLEYEPEHSNLGN